MIAFNKSPIGLPGLAPLNVAKVPVERIKVSGESCDIGRRAQNRLGALRRRQKCLADFGCKQVPDFGEPDEANFGG